MQYPHFNTFTTWYRQARDLWLQRQGQQTPINNIPRLLTMPHPPFVRDCSLTQEIGSWLRLLEWQMLPAAPPRQHFGYLPVPPATYIAAYLVKLDQNIRTMTQLRRFLAAHPALVWALGFPLISDGRQPFGFDVQSSLPTTRHFSRVLADLPNEALQNLLDGQVQRLRTWLPEEFGQTVSLDTKHIIAWVKENNPKAYIKEGRFHKTKQPVGDPDCKVGCKRRHNRQVVTPKREGQPATRLSVSMGEYYWGYASGIVVTRLAEWGEFVLAELTQTFDHGDTTYFFPLMAQVEKRLGFRPRFGALDAGFDAFYVYDYFHSDHHDGFAAVPFSEKGGKPTRQFAEDGRPLCAAALPMHLKFVYTDRTTAIIPYQRAKYVCPLLESQSDAAGCPVDHKLWPKNGCTTTLANTPGARIRHQLDRESTTYKQVYDQRTATERIFSQAVALDIERPKLRNQAAISNQNTLTYLLLNLREMRRLQEKLESAAE